MRLLPAIILALICVACEITLTENPSGAPAASPTGPTITVTNTATNQTTIPDRSDTGSPGTGGGGGGGTTIPAALPAYGETVTRDVAAANPTLLANSCQDVSGESAWSFLDLVIRTLKAQEQDLRWGYLCKDATCSTFARDVVAYRASAGDTGIWIVDVIGNHCPGPTDPPPAVRWGVLPFETVRKWAAARK